jgi:hypothetical protein
VIQQVLNAILQRFGLRLVNASYYDELLRMRYEQFFLADRVEQLEEELEECQGERDDAAVKIALLNLKDVAGTIGYEVHWLLEGVGEAFTLHAQDDSVDFRQTLEDINHALEIVLHDAAEVH